MFIRRCAGLLLALSLTAIFLPRGWAADQVPLALTAEMLTEEVLAANRALAGRRAATAALLSEAEAADDLDDPRLMLSAAPNTFGHRVDGRGQIQFSQSLPWPGKRGLRGDVALAVAEAAGESERVLARELAARAERLWAEWWYVHEALARSAEELRLVEELEPVAEAQYAAGLGLQQDLLRVQTRALRLEHQRLALAQRRTALIAEINALRGRPADAPLPSPAPMPPAPVVAPEAELADALVASHPALARIDASLVGARARLQLAHKDYWPDFRVYTGYVGALDPAQKRWQIGAEINLPFGGDKRRSAVSSAELEQDRLQAEREDLAFRLRAELRSLLARLDEAEQTVALYRDRIVPLSQQGLDAARADFESGRGEFANVIDAETALLDAKLTLARARADRLMTVAGIEALTGIDADVGRTSP
ncbi:TolC family protein [Lentisalinibacter orientalis]|uniref:TolC family protein n=1 Tax=Lentisalinibacter orientalis TaxID=2992241 RepID=UPI003867EC4A